MDSAPPYSCKFVSFVSFGSSCGTWPLRLEPVVWRMLLDYIPDASGPGGRELTNPVRTPQVAAVRVVDAAP
jgi:hypothetical protein